MKDNEIEYSLCWMHIFSGWGMCFIESLTLSWDLLGLSLQARVKHVWLTWLCSYLKEIINRYGLAFIMMLYYCGRNQWQTFINQPGWNKWTFLAFSVLILE